MELSEVFAKIVAQNVRIGQHFAVVTGIENDAGIYYLTIQIHFVINLYMVNQPVS